MRWSVELPAPPAGAPLVTPTMAVLPLSNGTIAGHGLRDGRPVWTATLPAERPLAGDDQRVYVASGDAVHALQLDSGSVVWRTNLGAKPTARPLAHAGWVIAAAGGQLFALRGSDGKMIWRSPVGVVEVRPALDGDLLIVSIKEGWVRAFDVQTGASQWDYHVGAAPGEPLALGGRVYVGTSDKGFLTLRASSGTRESRRSLGGVPQGQAAADDRHVYFAGMDNMLVAIHRAHGGIEWRQGLSYRPAGGPVFLGDRVVVPGYYVSSLPAFAARNGTRAGEVTFPAQLAVLPVFSRYEDGRSFVIGVIGDLTNRWRLMLLEALLVPVVPLAPLTGVPGELVPLPFSLQP